MPTPNFSCGTLTCNNFVCSGTDISFVSMSSTLNVTGNTILGNNLTVSGDLTVSGTINGSSSVGGYWVASDVSGIYYLNNVGIGGYANLNYPLYVTGPGYFNGSASASSFLTTSDYRIKENPEEIQYSIDDLNPVQYYNKKTNKKEFGFIAHEVQENYGFLVNGEKDGEELQNINYISIIALLTKEIQELKKKVSNTI
jgi:hypothetical protein